MNRIAALVFIALAAPQAFAGSAKFTTPAATGVVRTTDDLALKSVQAVVYCRFEDGSGFGGEAKDEVAPATLKEVANNGDTAGHVYEISVPEVNYNKGKLFISLQMCGYSLSFDGVIERTNTPVKGDVGLFGQFVTKKDTYAQFLSTIDSNLKTSLNPVKVRAVKAGDDFFITNTQ